jgi:CubicO group peptidase (beta-lactamase class C family)
VTPLPATRQPPAIRYRFRNIGYTLDDYLEHQRVTGLLILKNGEIVAERYRYGRSEGARFLSFSMAKSVTSMLVGIALDKGLIASLASLGVVARLDWRCFNRVRTCRNSVNRP